MFEGVHTALITPFKNQGKFGAGEIDYERLAALIERQITAGVNGITICGTTGESPALSEEEKLSLIGKTVEICSGRVQVIAGTGSNCTRSTVAFTEKAAALGVDGALVVVPYYNRPTQKGLLAHFELVAKESSVPVVLYNVPSRTGVGISLETFEKLLPHPNIVAVKEATNCSSGLLALARCAEGKASLLSGEDTNVFSLMTLGGTGVISASANVIPEIFVSITAAAKSGDWQTARQVQQDALPLINALFRESNPGPAKAALACMGLLPEEGLRLPLVAASEETRRELQRLLDGS